MPFDLKVGHYDAPPPDRIDPARLTDLRDADVFRFANHLAGTMEVEDGRITSFSQRGSGVLNNTHMRVAAVRPHLPGPRVPRPPARNRSSRRPR